MTTDITELAQLRKELSNPAIGSKDHLRTLALSLVEALEKAQGMEAYWKTQCRGITDHCEELQARIADLEQEKVALESVAMALRDDMRESRTVTVKLPQAVSAGGQGYQEKVERILTAAGIKWEAE